MIRAWIVDDEPLARRGLRDLLEGAPDLEVVGESEDGPEAVEAVRRHSPDLLFLDVQMPGFDGFDVLAGLEPERLPVVIFVTAYDLYALRAFEVHAADYLLKPVDPERLRSAVERARALLASRERGDSGARLQPLLDALSRRPGSERILIRAGASLEVVRVRAIDRIAADGDYVRIHEGGREHLLRETLQSLAGRLEPQGFVRIHRSHLVRVDRIRHVQAEESGDGAVVLEDGTRLPVSRSYRDGLMRVLRGDDEP